MLRSNCFFIITLLQAVFLRLSLECLRSHVSMVGIALLAADLPRRKLTRALALARVNGDNVRLRREPELPPDITAMTRRLGSNSPVHRR
jgi:hypothetical protein